MSFGGHTAQDPTAAHCDIAILMCKENGGTDTLIPATSWICPINACQNRNPHVFKFCMPEKCRPGTPPMGIKFHLLIISMDSLFVGFSITKLIHGNDPLADIGEKAALHV
jgi:hypothetical protein